MGKRFDIKNIDRDKVLLILKWCELKFGKSKHYKTYPKLIVYRTKGMSVTDCKLGLMGCFEKGKIKIYIGNHEGVRDLCSTVLHEYKHYLMGIKEFRKIYVKLRSEGKKNIMSIHPHEKRAERFEKKWRDLCFKELKNRLYEKNKD